MMSLLTASTTRRVLPRLVFDSIRTLATTGRGKKASSGPFLIDFASLRVFKAMHGHLKVPTRFSLSPDTPGVGWQAFGLGRHVDRLRYLAKSQPHRILAQDVVELDQMGFVWDAHKEAFQLLIEGMLIYHKLNGDFLVPIKFVVPTNDSLWPKKLWGMKIGRIFGAVRCEENLPLWQLQILKEHGIPCELYKDRDMMAERALTALQAYKLIMNIESGQQFTVHKNFTVPDEDPRWDPSLWGLQLGFVVSNIRCNGSYPEYHDRFRAVGLSLDNQYDVMAERILTALQAYKVNMNIEPGQEFTVPSSFVVPDGDARWDPALWGLPLGTAVSNIRSKNAYPDHHDKFRTVGLSFDNQYDVMAELILTALQAYKVNMNIEPGQEFTVPSLFKVPYEDVRWDPSLWGLALGTAVQSIRNSHSYPDYHERFRSVGLRLDKIKMRPRTKTASNSEAALETRPESSQEAGGGAEYHSKNNKDSDAACDGADSSASAAGKLDGGDGASGMGGKEKRAGKQKVKAAAAVSPTDVPGAAPGKGSLRGGDKGGVNLAEKAAVDAPVRAKARRVGAGRGGLGGSQDSSALR